MKKQFIFLIFLGLTFTLQAQFQISGKLQDTEQKPLSFASVVILHEQDSSMITFGLTDVNGNYQLDVKEKGDYLIQFSFLGYQTTYKKINTDWKNRKIELPIYQLKTAAVDLDEVEISAERIPMKMKDDTLVYDAAAFKTKDGEAVEKLLEKLPGVEVDEQGNVTAQGKTVTKVLVNGKEFFGSNPKMATQNLDAEAVKSVEVLDKKSEEAEFTGVDDGSEEKTINITLKEEYNKGYFGRVSGAVGTEETYKGSASINYFDEKNQLSLIGGGNNLNELNFSFSEYSDFQGGNISDFNSSAIGYNLGDGINSSLSAGLNWNRTINKKLKVTANYFYVNNTNELIKTINSSNFTPTETFETAEVIDNEKQNIGHSSDIRLEWNPDSMNRIDYRMGFSLSDNEADNKSYTEYTSESSGVRETSTLNKFEENSFKAYSDLSYNRRLKKKGRSLLFKHLFRLGEQEEENLIDNQIFNSDLYQFQNFSQQQQQNRLSLKYTEPIIDKWYANFTYSYDQEYETPERNFFDLQNGRSFNDSLSGAFSRDIDEHKGNFSIQRSTKKSVWEMGSALSQIHLKTSETDSDFRFLYPYLTVRFRLKGSQNLRMGYRTSTNLPNLNQLITITNNINPNQLYVGNNQLRPEYAHNFNINYFFFDPLSSSSYYIGLRAADVQDKIVNRTRVNSDLRREITPQNTDSYQSLTSYFGISKKFKKWNLQYRFNGSSSFSRYEAFLNDELSQVASESYWVGGRIGRDKDEKWDLDFGFEYTFNKQEYELNSNFNQRFDQVRWYASGELQILENLLLNADYSIRNYANAFFSEARQLHFIDLSLRQSLMNDKWAITFIVHDLLNENVGIRRSGDLNSLRDEEYNSRAQYFMLQISTKLGKRKDGDKKRKYWMH